jgi:biotin carboxyl carrier protein
MEDGFTLLRVRVDGREPQAAEARLDGDHLRLRFAGRVLDLWLDGRAPSGDAFVSLGSERARVEVHHGGLAAGRAGGPRAQGPVRISSPMPGRLVLVRVSVGQQVARGELLFTLEAMKMQNEFVSPVDGRVKSLLIGPGHVAAAGEVLAEIEPDSPRPA